MLLKPDDLTTLTLLGSPVVNPKNSRFILFAKSWLDTEKDCYLSELILLNRETKKYMDS